MNNDTFEGDRKQMKARAMEQWGNLTEDDLEAIAAQRDELAGRLQERQGMAKRAARIKVTQSDKRGAAARATRP